MQYLGGVEACGGVEAGGGTLKSFEKKPEGYYPLLCCEYTGTRCHFHSPRPTPKCLHRLHSLHNPIKRILEPPKRLKCVEALWRLWKHFYSLYGPDNKNFI